MTGLKAAAANARSCGSIVARSSSRLFGPCRRSRSTYRQQLDRVQKLRKALATATGEPLREIRTRLAQTLREALIRIDFGPDTVTCRVRIERIRFAIGHSQLSPYPNGVPVVAIDERPRVPMTEFEMSIYAPEPGEREVKAAEADWFVEMMERTRSGAR